MSNSIETNSTEAIIDNTNHSQFQNVRVISTLLQVFAVSLCFEMLLGIPETLGVFPRLAILATIMFCVVLRVGWLALIALQLILFFQEPRNQPLQQSLSGILFVLVAILTIVSAMNLPQLHVWVTNYGLEQFRFGSSRPSIGGFRIDLVTIAVRCLQVGLVTILPCYLLAEIPIGRQSSAWLKWSLENGQAVWPGTLMIVLVFGVLVLVREYAWRQLLPTQASLYLRSLLLIGNYRDLSVFERYRLKQYNMNATVDEKSTPAVVRRPKLRKKRESSKPDSKGLP